VRENVQHALSATIYQHNYDVLMDAIKPFINKRTYVNGQIQKIKLKLSVNELSNIIALIQSKWVYDNDDFKTRIETCESLDCKFRLYAASLKFKACPLILDWILKRIDPQNA
jgi:predicted enzyme involved in methoxymalonyl-ACP biosynthesis